MITVAEEATLALPEFKALNQGLALPRMRCWEMPFALFNAQLTNTMAVLDCPINPVTFQQRLALLYPHVLYRHWNPIQTGTFQLAAGIPDRSFDCVICINTLEHLLKPQREALMSAMVRKLKPGGRLIVTCDYYFDSFWSDPAFLSSGLTRTDREEVFNGFNKVTAGELMALGEANGLVPLCDGERREPVETDPALYRQQLPFPHACVAAIFRNGAEAPPPPGKKIVLALLSWNTRDVTIDSLRAYLEEAAMLRRLGQRPLICVCDNGSTDGTAAALQKCEPDIDFPHRMILNPANLGNSVGRNQMRGSSRSAPIRGARLATWRSASASWGSTSASTSSAGFKATSTRAVANCCPPSPKISRGPACSPTSPCIAASASKRRRISPRLVRFRLHRRHAHVRGRQPGHRGLVAKAQGERADGGA
jgi:SAM-dependent methyltransferase